MRNWGFLHFQIIDVDLNPSNLEIAQKTAGRIRHWMYADPPLRGRAAVGALALRDGGITSRFNHTFKIDGCISCVLKSFINRVKYFYEHLKSPLRLLNLCMGL